MKGEIKRGVVFYTLVYGRKALEGELAELLEGILAEHTTEHWMDQLEAAGVVAGPICDMDQVYSDEQVLARDMLVELEDEELGKVKNIGVPVKLSATPGRIRHRGRRWGSTAGRCWWSTGTRRRRWRR